MGFQRVIPRLIGCASCLVAATSAAQEAINESAEVDRGRRARKEAIDQNLYNIKAGPVLLRFDALMGFEFNDNPNLLDDPGKVDFAFHPQVDISSLWPVSSKNALSLNLGIGYVKYVNATELDHVVIAPSSELSFDIYTGDVSINLHERVTHTQDPVRDPSVSGTGDFGGIENTVGTRVDWDLNQAQLSFGYDHFNFISTSSALNDVPDRASELFYSRAAFKVTPDIRTGLEIGGGLTDYENDVFHDNTQFSAGPFVEVDLTRQMKLRAAGGYVRYDFDSTGTSIVPSEVDDFYADLSAEHQLSQSMSHRLSLGREARPGTTAELLTMWYARYENNWNLMQHSTLHSSVFYENGKQRGGFIGERFERVGLGAAISFPLSRKLTSTAGYQLLYKNADVPNRDYLQNSVTLEFKYAF